MGKAENNRLRKVRGKWLDKHGKPLECFEKIKILEQNLEEIKTLMAEAVEDARIMGAAEGQVETALASILKPTK